MGGGIFATSKIEITGRSYFEGNVAGFEWHKNSSSQVGGAVLLGAGSSGSNVTRDVQFVRNVALGGFGGGLALVGAGEVAMHGPVVVQNSVEGRNGQGGGLSVHNTRLAAGSTFRATANQALGMFKNVFLADKLADLKANGSLASSVGCASCSPCQLCNPDSGKCEFPSASDLVDWCKFIGVCNNQTCPWVAVGSAKFTPDMRGLSVTFDVDMAIGSSSVECASLLDANSTALLGSAPRCSIQQAPAASSSRHLAGATASSTLIIQLGPGYTVEPGSPLYFQQSALSATYQPLTGAGLVEVQQTGQTQDALRAALSAARSGSAGAGAGAGTIAPSQGSTANGGSASGSGGLEGGHIAAIAVGSAAGVAALVTAFFVAWRRLGRPVASGGQSAHDQGLGANSGASRGVFVMHV
eukprot:tig00000025_g7949.t1